MAVLTDIVYRGNGFTATFDNNAVVEATYELVDGLLVIQGLTDEQRDAVLVANALNPHIGSDGNGQDTTAEAFAARKVAFVLEDDFVADHSNPVFRNPAFLNNPDFVTSMTGWGDRSRPDDPFNRNHFTGSFAYGQWSLANGQYTNVNGFRQVIAPLQIGPAVLYGGANSIAWGWGCSVGLRKGGPVPGQPYDRRGINCFSQGVANACGGENAFVQGRQNSGINHSFMTNVMLQGDHCRVLGTGYNNDDGAKNVVIQGERNTTFKRAYECTLQGKFNRLAGNVFKNVSVQGAFNGVFSGLPVDYSTHTEIRLQGECNIVKGTSVPQYRSIIDLQGYANESIDGNRNGLHGTHGTVRENDHHAWTSNRNVGTGFFGPRSLSQTGVKRDFLRTDGTTGEQTVGTFSIRDDVMYQVEQGSLSLMVMNLATKVSTWFKLPENIGALGTAGSAALESPSTAGGSLDLVQHHQAFEATVGPETFTTKPQVKEVGGDLEFTITPPDSVPYIVQLRYWIDELELESV